MFSEVVFGDGKVRGTRYFLSGVAPIGLELLLIASLLLYSGRTRAFCSVIRQAAEERVHHRVRTPSHAESALAFVFSILMPCCSCLAICVLLCRLPPVLTLTCTTSILDTTIPAIEYTTIPANKGAEGAVSVRERAVNEAALAVCFAPVSHGVFVWLCFRGAAPRFPGCLPCRCPRSLFPYARMAGFRSPLRGGPMPRPP